MKQYLNWQMIIKRVFHQRKTSVLLLLLSEKLHNTTYVEQDIDWAHYGLRHDMTACHIRRYHTAENKYLIEVH